MKHEPEAVEKYLRGATRGLWGHRRREIQEELRAHVEERTLAHRIGGMDEKGALERALAELGDPSTVQKGMLRLHALPEIVHAVLQGGNTMLKNPYPYAAAVAIAATLMLVWLSLGVGIIGRDGDPANLLYVGVIAVGVVGTAAARFRSRGMARTLFAAASIQALIALVAVIAKLGAPWSGPLELIILNGFFVALFVGSALLFQRAGQRGMPASSG